PEPDDLGGGNQGVVFIFGKEAGDVFRGDLGAGDLEVEPLLERVVEAGAVHVVEQRLGEAKTEGFVVGAPWVDVRNVVVGERRDRRGTGRSSRTGGGAHAEGRRVHANGA